VLLSISLLHGPRHVEAQRLTEGCENPFGNRSALRFNTYGWETDFCKHSVPYHEIQSGGPPRDGIPPIDDPSFVTIADADGWLDNREPVIVLKINEVTRAYPLQIMTWHEIVNDVVAGVPVAVTFCPLCYAAIVFERPSVEGDLLTFGTSGNLRHSDLVMWDRQTESWWQQFNGEAIVGSLTGMKLTTLPAPLISWGEFKTRFPDADVLSRRTGHARRYGDNPYVGYDDVAKKPWLFEGETDGDLRPMERIIGVEAGLTSKAYLLRDVRSERTLHDTIDGVPIVLFWTPEAASAVDRREIAKSKRIGSVGAYRALLDGRKLSFRRSGDGLFEDEQTGSTWNLFGESIDGSLKGERLKPLVHHNTFWFVWSVFRPESPLWKS
jgi:hypothetical protein